MIRGNDEGLAGRGEETEMRKRLEEWSGTKRCSGRSGDILGFPWYAWGQLQHTWVDRAPSHADFATRPFRICPQYFAMVALRSLNGRAALCQLRIPWLRAGRRASKHRPNLHLDRKSVV